MVYIYHNFVDNDEYWHPRYSEMFIFVVPVRSFTQLHIRLIGGGFSTLNSSLATL